MTSLPDPTSDAVTAAEPSDTSWFAGQEAAAAAAARRDGGGARASGPSAFPADRDPMFDPEWNPPRRFNRLSGILVAALVAAGAFAGGAALQRSHDAGLATTATGARAGRLGGAGGFPSGFPGFGGGAVGPGAGPASGGAGSGATAAGNGGGAATDTPVVVGTVVSVQAGTVTVKNFAGATVVVHLPATATVTVTGATALQPGASVAVHGTKAADGSVTATALVSRKAAG